MGSDANRIGTIHPAKKTMARMPILCWMDSFFGLSDRKEFFQTEPRTVIPKGLLALSLGFEGLEQWQ